MPGHGSASLSRSAKMGFFIGTPKPVGVMSVTVIAGNGWKNAGARDEQRGCTRADLRRCRLTNDTSVSN